jgi:N-acetylglutamate synthase-like GNAT family acetyltransferase
MVRKAKKKDLEACNNLAKDLPDWFNEKGLKEISEDLSVLPTFIYEDGDILGFICVENKTDNVAEIKQFAVKKGVHRQGIGGALLRYVESEVAPGKIIEVKTLDESVEYEPYAKTRAFYEKKGFVKIEAVDPYPGWDAGNPCAIYVKLNR